MRIVIAAILLGASFGFIDHVGTSLTLAVIAMVLAGTAVTGRCPAYTLFHLDTRSMAKGVK